MIDNNVDYSLLNEVQEHELVTQIGDFNNTVKTSALQYRPHVLARYLIDLSQKFNEYYHKVPVLKADEDVRRARIILISAVMQVLGNGLNILGIDVLEKM